MLVAIDTSTLLLFLSPLAHPPTDQKTGQPVPFAQGRVQFLIETFEEKRAKIIIPTPALSEALVHAGSAASSYVAVLENRSVFRIASFDMKAAIEASIAIRHALRKGDKKDGLATTWAKVKFDRQIVAIAKVEGAERIYSDDGDLGTLGPLSGIPVSGLASCPLRPTQSGLFPSQETSSVRKLHPDQP